jgi:hypothetical protein
MPRSSVLRSVEMLVPCFLAMGALTFACGGSTGAPGGGSSSGGSSGGTSSSGGSLSSACPASAPAAGTSCSSTVSCQYGTDPNLLCDTHAICMGAGWQVTAPASGARCPTGTPGSGGCPATTPTGTCTTEMNCAYPDALCGCSNPDPVVVEGMDAGLQWSCATAPAGCPNPRPLAGSACATEGQSCAYGDCVTPGGPIGFTCKIGAWYASLEGCE